MNDRVLLHVRQKQPVDGKLHEFPQHANRHGKTEGRQRQIKRRELEAYFRVTVEYADQRKAERRAQKAPDRVQQRVPVGIMDVVAGKLPQYLRRKHMEHNDDLQQRRKLYVGLILNDRRQEEHEQDKQAGKAAFKVVTPDRTHQNRQHDQAENIIHDDR